MLGTGSDVSGSTESPGSGQGRRQSHVLFVLGYKAITINKHLKEITAAGHQQDLSGKREKLGKET